MKKWTTLKRTHKMAVIAALVIALAGGGTAAAITYNNHQAALENPAQSQVVTQLATPTPKAEDKKADIKVATIKSNKKTPAPIVTPAATSSPSPTPSATPLPTATPKTVDNTNQTAAKPVDDAPVEQPANKPIDNTSAEQTAAPDSEPEPVHEEPYITMGWIGNSGRVLPGYYEANTYALEQMTNGLFEEKNYSGWQVIEIVYSDGTWGVSVNFY